MTPSAAKAQFVLILLVSILSLSTCLGSPVCAADLGGPAGAGDLGGVYKALAEGANPSPEITEYGAYGPLYLAAFGGHVPVLAALIDAGAAVNHPETSLRQTALHAAARADQMRAARFLVAEGADATLADSRGQTAADVADSFGHHELAWFLRNAPAGRKLAPEKAGFVLPATIASPDPDRVYSQLREGKTLRLDQSERFLASAAVRDDTEIVNLLLDFGVPADGMEWTTLRRTPLSQAFEHMKLNSARLLLEGGADPAVTNKDGSTALSVFLSSIFTADGIIQSAETMNERLNLLDVLIARVNSVNERAQDGRTALHTLALTLPGADYWESPDLTREQQQVMRNALQQVFDALLEAGVDCYAGDRENRTPLNLALKKKNKVCAEALLSREIRLVPPVRVEYRFRSVPFVALRYGDSRGFVQSVFRSLTSSVSSHLDIDVDTRLSPLQMAILEGDPESVQLLLQHVADVRRDQGVFGWRPLHLAVLTQDETMLRMFLRMGADCRQEDAAGKSPVELARFWGLDDMAKLLEGCEKGFPRIPEPPSATLDEAVASNDPSELESYLYYASERDVRLAYRAVDACIAQKDPAMLHVLVEYLPRVSFLTLRRLIVAFAEDGDAAGLERALTRVASSPQGEHPAEWDLCVKKSLQSAAEHGHAECVRLLLRVAAEGRFAAGYSTYNYLRAALEKSDLATARALVDEYPGEIPANWDSLVTSAARRKDMESLRFLMGIKGHVYPETAVFALSSAYECGDTEIVDALVDFLATGKPKRIPALRRRFDESLAEKNDDLAALLLSRLPQKLGTVDLAELLCSAAADGRTSLAIGAMDAGAAVNCDCGGQTPLDLALKWRWEDLGQSLKERGGLSAEEVYLR